MLAVRIVKFGLFIRRSGGTGEVLRFDLLDVEPDLAIAHSLDHLFKRRRFSSDYLCFAEHSGYECFFEFANDFRLFNMVTLAPLTCAAVHNKIGTVRSW